MKVGRTSAGYHIDRIDPLRGYTLDNIRLLSAPENGAKGATADKAAHRARYVGTLRREYNPESRKMEFWMNVSPPALPAPDCPF